MIEVTDGHVDARVVLGLEAAAEDDLDARPSHHDAPHDHDHEDFESIIVDIPELSDPAELTARIERLANELNILRVKGYASVAGKPMRLLVRRWVRGCDHSLIAHGAHPKTVRGALLLLRNMMTLIAPRLRAF